jgi:nickel/cobalt exporter
MSEASLLGTAAAIGAVHTLLGPDHYIPFVALARAGGWSRARTLALTLICWLGHVLGSVVLGLVGIGLGLAVSQLEAIETRRGELAAWLLIGFGLAYAGWGVWRALRHRPHSHLHVHAAPGGGAIVHDHPHAHTGEHVHPHGNPARLTPWVLFTIFIFGPCEPLIPLLMVPAAQGNWGGVAAVTLVFGATTLATMAAIVMLALAGVARLSLGTLERYTHALAGAALAACGFAIRYLGL